MRLKSIMLHGFKSFCNRTEVPLGEGITGIVGPNGCGKSNVSDAVRWVLGEGNVRNLRGENILDVIFKGSGTMKPSGFAEVSLIVDNEDHALPMDHSEVAIARRVYRSGDSDFLINQLPCRLKDIRNLFLGTGLGTHGYSVIEREMVDAVLSDHDEQRRLFFEEAAGISRYKIQRKEASRKLEATEQDLTRIDDIVREIEREVRSLARQVGKARRYERVLVQLKDLEVGLALRQWFDLERRRVDTASERDQWSDERERLSADLAGREADLESRRLRLIERERLLDEARRLREDLIQEDGSNRREDSILATRIQGWEQREQDLIRRIEEESVRESAMRRRIEESLPERTRIEAQMGEARALAEAAESRFAIAEEDLRTARTEAARTAQIQMEQLLVRTKDSKELENLRSQEEQHVLRRSFLLERQDGLRRKSAELGEGMQILEQDLSVVNARLAALADEQQSAHEERTIAEADREELRQRREDLARRRASIESRLALMREQKARHDGFDVPIRSLLERRGALEGIHGVVGELVAAADWLPEPVAEALLADAVQWVVVEDEDAACRALDLLKGEGQGGVVFFPLRENEGRAGGGKTAPAGGWKESPLKGPAELAPLIRFLESRVHLADTRDGARAAAAARRGDDALAGPALRHLSPEGEIFATEGWIRAAGGREEDREIIERMREIPRLEETLAKITDEETEVSRRLGGRETEIASLVTRLQEMAAEGASLTMRQTRADREMSEKRVERGLILEEEERATEELSELDGRIARLVADRSDLERRLGDSDTSGQEAEERHRQAKAAEEGASARRDSALRDLSGKKTDAMRVENALRELDTAIARDREEADRIAAAVVQWGAERDEAVRLREDAIAQRATLAARAAEIGTQLAGAEERLDARRRERDEDQSLLAVQEHDIREVRGQLNGLQERLHGDQVREIEIRSEMERLRDRLRSEFRIDLMEEASRIVAAAQSAAAVRSAEGTPAGPGTLPPPQPEEPEESVRARIEDLRRTIASLGAVNFVASEEYARQKERLLFHRTQQEDLRRAQKDLLETIRQINETAGQMFRETFDAARENFRITFEQLFPGGEADVRLLGDDPLEGEIEIFARPRGKKLEAVRLLSTGERALTAIALLFGIYLVKPSPFCVLDELDAPLDDANIGRFVQMLRHFAEKTQFVVITHNKRTMEAADRLYGVTMPVPGISKIVSVKLTDVEVELGLDGSGGEGPRPAQAGETVGPGEGLRAPAVDRASAPSEAGA